MLCRTFKQKKMFPTRGLTEQKQTLLALILLYPTPGGKTKGAGGGGEGAGQEEPTKPAAFVVTYLLT